MQKNNLGPFQANIPFIYQQFSSFSMGIEMEHWLKMG